MHNPFRYFNSSPEVIRLAVMMYVRYPLSLRQVEDLLCERGIDICHETVRYWWNRFGPLFAAEIRKRRVHHRFYSLWRWHLDEVFVRINGKTHYLWRAVDHEGEVVEVFVTKRRDRRAALEFLTRAMKRYGRPASIVTDRLPSYRAAMKVIGNEGCQETGRWLNNRAENSHQPFRRREGAMARFRVKWTPIFGPAAKVVFEPAPTADGGADTMKKTRTKHSPAFKAKVALAALRDQESVAEIARRYKVHANVVYKWKRQLLDNAAQSFETDHSDGGASDREDVLLKKIGELTVERDFLSNGLGRSR